MAIVLTSCVGPFLEESEEPIDLRFGINDFSEPMATSGTVEFGVEDTDLLGLENSTHPFKMSKSSAGGVSIQRGRVDIPTGYTYQSSSEVLTGDPGNPCLQDDVHAFTNIDPKPRIIIPAGFCFGDDRSDITWTIDFDMRDNTLQFFTDPAITVAQN